MERQESDSLSKLSYLLIGGGIGAVIALLFAQKTGEEFRADIAETTRKGLDKTRETANQLGGKAQTVYEDTKSKVGDIYNSATKSVNEAVDSTKQAASELSDNIHDGIKENLGNKASAKSV
jgi:gas vesicle protein